MKKKVLIFSICLILVLIIGVNVYKTQGKVNEINVRITHLKKKNITNKVMIPGILKLAEEQYIYYDAQKGNINNIHVTEGSIVQIGTPIITYESDELDLQQEQNRLATKSSQLQINSLTTQIANLNKKQKELEKEVSKEEAKNQIDSERAQLQIDLETANLELEKNKLEGKSITKKEKDLEVKSEINGTVLEVDKGAINTVSDIQKSIVHIGNTNQYLASGMLSEYDALNIKVGQPVTITSDVLPDKRWTGLVKQIDYLPQQQSISDGANDGANEYPVEININDDDIKSIKPGFKLILEIETSSKKANSLPTKSIVNKDKSTYVYIVKDGKAVRKKVKTGKTTNEITEIKNGLSGKEKVISNPSNQLTDGMEVNVQ